MKTYLIPAILIALIIIIGLWHFGYRGNLSGADTEPELIDAVTYACDGGRMITAAYFESQATTVVEPDEMPQPTGHVEVSLDGGEPMTLAQTISASGIRYANEDESFVFWSRGDEALVMRDNTMDLTYTNCREE